MNIIGARGRIEDIDSALSTISAMERETCSTIQMFRADRIFGREHVQTAAELALRNRDRGKSKARTLGMEILLFAAAERQISGAIGKLGISEDTENLALAIIGPVEPDHVLEALGLERDDSVLEPEGKDHSIFGISLEEARTAPVPEIIIERMALSQFSR